MARELMGQQPCPPSSVAEQYVPLHLREWILAGAPVIRSLPTNLFN